ncbi:MAG: hypothetical protein ACLFVT_09915 [Syntrophobacteria bacterium]
MRMFSPEEIKVVSQAVEIAEDVTANHFKISTSQWKHVRYDICTLAHLRTYEITEAAFAQITRYSRNPGHMIRRGGHWDYFKICLQDHSIAAAVERDEGLQLLPLSVYVVAHELVHVVRFCTFLQRFDADPLEREREEARVHNITQKALKGLSLSHLDYVLQVYQDHQIIETFRDSP